MNDGKTLFGQLMDFVPWKTVGRIVKRHDGDAGVKKLNCVELFRIMLFAQLTYRESLRDIDVCLVANAKKLYHMGITQPPARSTMSDALNRRDWRMYQDIAHHLISIARKLYAADVMEVDLKETVYAFDATTIDLCLAVFPWADFRSTKAAVKMHTLIDLRGSIPTFIHISTGKMHEVNSLDELVYEHGAFYLVDRGYLDFARLYALHLAGSFFVIRAKKNTKVERRYSRPVDRVNTRVVCDQVCVLTGVSTQADYPIPIRRVVVKNEEGKRLVFLTNNMHLNPEVIGELYRQRWKVELFFKWIKQHLRIKVFYGTSENAVKAQIWCAIAAYVLIAIVKKELGLVPPIYTLLQVFSVSIFEKTPIKQAFLEFDRKARPPEVQKQPNLWEI